MSVFVGFWRAMWDNTCYELEDEARKNTVLPYQFDWKDGMKRELRWDRTIKGIADLRKIIKDDNIKMMLTKNTDIMEVCNRCQIKKECDNGFPGNNRGLWSRLFF